MRGLEQRSYFLYFRLYFRRREQRCLRAGQPGKLLPVAGAHANAMRGTRMAFGNGDGLSQQSSGLNRRGLAELMESSENNQRRQARYKRPSRYTRMYEGTR